MQVALHVGAHFTDDGKLLASLQKNTDMLAARGVSIPRPSTYRQQLRTAFHTIRKTALTPDIRHTLLEGMKDPVVPVPDRIILSNSNFFAVPKISVRGNVYYPGGEERLQDFSSLFSQEEVEVFLAIRNPATFLPALLAGSPCETLDELISGSAPTALRWAELVLRIRAALPAATLTVWCNEDTPLIWEQLLRELAGVEPIQPIEGGNDLLHEIMSEEGLERFATYVATHDGMTEIQKRRVIAAFLDKFALEEELEETLDLPGWTEEFVDALTEIYDEDVYNISRIPGVTLISP